jgi:2-keto-4-pentenoate hydratase
MTMTPDQIEQAARIFDKARKGNYMIDEVPAELGLVDLDDAAKVAERVVELSGEKVVGFLVGATNPEMQKSLKTVRPT